MRVTVMMPTYNRGQIVNGLPLVERAIISFLNQDYENSDLIILNDASTDSTKEILSRYEDHQRIKIYHSETNLMPPNNQNWLWDHSQGELLCQLHDDDEMPPYSISTRVNEFKKNPSLQVVYGGAYLQNIHGQRQGIFYGQLPDKQRIFKEEYINFTTLMYRRDLPFRFEGTLRYYFDWLFKIRCLNECETWYVPDPVMTHTMHPGQESNKCRFEGQNAAQEKEMRELLKKIYDNR